MQRIAEVLLDGKEPVNPIYLNQTDKVKLLVYAGTISVIHRRQRHSMIF